MAYINLLSTSETSIRVNVAGLQEAYASNDRVCDWYLDGQYKDSTTLGAGASSGGAITFRGLSPGTWYSIEVIISGNGWTNPALSEYFMTNERRIAEWSWFASNGSASAQQTGEAFDAVKFGYETTNFFYLVWNDLVDKVNEVIIAAGGTWSDMYATLSETKMSFADRNLTAKRFNALRQNIGSRYSTGIQEVSPGDTVFGQYFITLTDKLNEWIATLQ